MSTPIQISDVLVNAQSKHIQFPENFYAPSQEELAEIVPGSYVKIEVEFDKDIFLATGERFCVCVTEVTDTSITGKVSNNLIFTLAHNLTGGDVVQFDFWAVMDILRPEPQE